MIRSRAAEFACKVSAMMTAACWRSAAGACLLGLASWAYAAAEPVTNRFGFAGKEIFPIDYQITQLHAADLDGDGLQDLIVVNNARSKIALLYNQTGKTNQAQSSSSSLKRELNELPMGSRFKLESIA